MSIDLDEINLLTSSSVTTKDGRKTTINFGEESYKKLTEALSKNKENKIILKVATDLINSNPTLPLEEAVKRAKALKELIDNE